MLGRKGINDEDFQYNAAAAYANEAKKMLVGVVRRSACRTSSAKSLQPDR